MSEDGKNNGGVGIPVGATIGKYEVVERRAIGGQAIVYKGRDPLLDRFVAIKQISTHLAEDPKFLERFRREAKILAKLGAEQSTVITIYELIEDERGLFIVMEFVPGHTLETILAENDHPVEPKAALQILWRLAAGLHAVHAAGIIHRDIKPSNIIISEGLHPKITDFGVAASLTGQTSMLLGTTKYMAPELLSAETIDGRADIYSLGFVMYELLLGRPKFNEIFADVVRDKHSESLRWMKWHGNPDEIAPPLHEVNSAIPESLSVIVAKMIAKDPDDRYENMEALGRAIKQTFSPRAKATTGGGYAPPLKELRPIGGNATVPPGEQELVLEDTAPTAPLPKKPLSMRRKLVLVGILVAVVIVTGVWWGIKEYQKSAARRQTAGEVMKQAQDAYRAGIKEYPDKRLAYRDEKLREALDGFEELQNRFGGSREAAKASVLAPLTRAYRAVLAEDWEEAAKAQQLASDQLDKVQTDRDDLIDWSKQIQDEIDNFEGYRISARKFQQVYANANTALANKEYNHARDILVAGTSELQLTQNQNTDVKDLQKKISVQQFESEYASEITRADALMKQDKLDEARAIYQSLQEQVAANTSQVDSQRRVAMLDELRGKLAALSAQAEYLNAMERIKAAEASGNKGELLTALRALEKIRPSKELEERINTVIADGLYEEGQRFLKLGQLVQARASFEKSLKAKKTEKAEKALAAMNRADKRQSLMTAADVAFRDGRYEEALKQYLSASKIETDDEVNGKIIECRYRIQLAELNRLRREKRYKEALVAAEKLLEIRPAESAKIEAIQEEIRRQQQYDDYLAQGDSFFEARRYDRARKAYQAAKEVQQTREVNDRLINVRYQESYDLGVEAMNRRDYNSALAYFKIAKKMKDTPEVKKRIREANAQLQESK